ncbi:MAG TPA: preprotein translocase subunit SecE [Halanaerobiaceae bacterium]|jgi:preprotein translocase subunit SecE|nr:preprotein translocase subunit SecE [Bacillota bacterium]HHU92588.1 preprotein translocase subunit SecE [Halanaerobiaceae bacterium]HOA40469.1 preprotein translocase subunit SecE [Halanaerobiales bacterium]HPZ62688.1 preprotein translocase subunit SecE [Halanaerobiales bacterium]HQD03482.1 preprotein translocase subunit SecE [Halanaerobiales bacterium]
MSKKLGFGGRIAKFFRQVKAELKKVNWPNKEELTKNTAVVVVTIVVLTLFIALIDLILGSILTPIIL